MLGVEIDLKTSLPDIIQDEIFRLSTSVSDVIIDHLCSDIERCGYTVGDIYNLDCSIIFRLVCADEPNVIAEVRIDRIQRSFEVVGKSGDYTILPVSGTWADVLAYLEKLTGM